MQPDISHIEHNGGHNIPKWFRKLTIGETIQSTDWYAQNLSDTWGLRSTLSFHTDEQLRSGHVCHIRYVGPQNKTCR